MFARCWPHSHTQVRRREAQPFAGAGVPRATGMHPLMGGWAGAAML